MHEGDVAASAARFGEVELPVGEHPALDDGVDVGAGVVGVAVDDELDACGAGRFGDGAFNDVEVARVLRSLVFGGALPQGLVYDGGALVGGLGEEAFLPDRVAQYGATGLADLVADAPLIAVCEEDRIAVDGNDDLVGDELGTAGLGEVGAQKGVVGALHDEHAAAGRGVELEFCDDRVGFGRGVVAEPVVEEVAQNDEFGKARRDVLHEAQERHDGLGLVGRKMHVGDDDGIGELGHALEAAEGRNLFVCHGGFVQSK